MRPERGAVTLLPVRVLIAIGVVLAAFDARAACEADACDASDTECEDRGCVFDADRGDSFCERISTVPEGTACGDSTDTECDHADSCDGFGSCMVNYAGEGAICGDPSNTDCTFSDACSGAGTCLRNDLVGACEDDANDCTADLCTAGVCTHDPTLAGTGCDLLGAEGVCEDDVCDGAGACVLSDRADGADCDDGQYCNGQSVCEAGVCVDGFLPCPDHGCNEATGYCYGNDGDVDTDSDGDLDSDTDTGLCNCATIPSAGAAPMIVLAVLALRRRR